YADPALPPVRILPAARIVRYGERRIALTRLEFDLLLLLARNPSRTFTRQQLLRTVWGRHEVATRTVDVHVRRLRVKLGEQPPVVTTVRGVGYRIGDDRPVLIDAGH
ncbi:MAG TPA: winged helix-turn-helix domain-containing protein, partial [Micromonospora sp.]